MPEEGEVGEFKEKNGERHREEIITFYCLREKILVMMKNIKRSEAGKIAIKQEFNLHVTIERQVSHPGTDSGTETCSNRRDPKLINNQ